MTLTLVPTEEPRSYCIGLPVMFTINPDGTVTVEVDLSESTDIDDDEEAFENYGDLQVVRDTKAIETLVNARPSAFQSFNL